MRRWRRDARLPAYRDWLLAANKYLDALQKRERTTASTQALRSAEISSIQDEMRAAMAAIRLLGPQSVEQAARQMNNSLYAWDRREDPNTSEATLLGHASFEAAYRAHREELIAAAKKVLLH